MMSSKYGGGPSAPNQPGTREKGFLMNRKSKSTTAAMLTALLSAAVIALLVPTLASAQPPSPIPGPFAKPISAPPGPKPTIVLVHGAWADSSSWDNVIPLLQADGYTVDAPPNPLRGLASDSAYLASYLQTISGPIVLVGHSYGGAVITNAATGNANVKALVYVDAFAPAAGETLFGLTAAQPGSCVGADAFNLVPFPGAPSGDADTFLKVGPNKTYPGFASCFANGLSKQEAALL